MGGPTAFQRNAFQNNAFQIGGVGGFDTEQNIVPWRRRPDHNVDYVLAGIAVPVGFSDDQAQTRDPFKRRLQPEQVDVIPPLHPALSGFFDEEPIKAFNVRRQPDLNDVIPSLRSTFSGLFDTTQNIQIFKVRHQADQYDVIAPLIPTTPPIRSNGADWWRERKLYEDECERLREDLTDNIRNLDEKLKRLAEEGCEEDELGGSAAKPDAVFPPGWREEQKREREAQAKAKAKEEPPVRHVHYNFASDVDPEVRRKVVTFLQTAERVKIDLFGSDLKVAPGELVVGDRHVPKGTTVWSLQLDSSARLGVAKFLTRRGFKLVSFDLTSLEFVHRKSIAWKTALVGAGVGIMVGYWLRRPYPGMLPTDSRRDETPDPPPRKTSRKRRPR